MRVLVIAYGYPDPTSPQTGHYALRQIKALEKLGWEARVARFVPWRPPLTPRWRKTSALRSSYEFEEVHVDVARVIMLPGFRFMESLPLQTKRFVQRIASQFEPDIIHGHQLVPTGLLVIDQGYPAVITAHGSDTYNYPYRNATFQKAARRVATSVDKVVAVSNFIAGHAERLGAHDVEVVFNGADPATFSPRDRNSMRQELGIPNDRKVVLFAGLLSEAKGVFDLCAALTLVSDLRPLLIVAGSGKDGKRLETRLTGDRIDHRFIGAVDHHALSQYIGAADTVVLPSHREGLPLIICETMLSGRAMIATSVGGIGDIVKDGDKIG